MDCDHTGTQSGATQYQREADRLRLVIVCDECGAVCSELATVPYTLAPRNPQPQAVPVRP